MCVFRSSKPKPVVKTAPPSRMATAVVKTAPAPAATPSPPPENKPPVQPTPAV